MQAPDETTDDATPAAPVAAGRETVIKFVLSGPILADGTIAEVAHAAAPADAGLRERVTALERALADATNRLDALSQALAVAIAAGARPAVTPAAVAPVPAPGGPSSIAPPGALALAAGPADSDHRALAVAPSPDAGAVAAPKTRGLRRMISVLKHG